MKKAKKIEKFIRECFKSLSINYKNFFYYYYDDGQFEDIEWFDENGNINIDAVNHASHILGISTEDILESNHKPLIKWERKYRYFQDVKLLDLSREKSLHGDEYDAVRMIEVLFDTDASELYTNRYNYNDVIRRLVSQLKEYDKSFPGTYHQNAELTKLTIKTANFCHFDEIKPMTECYLEMVERTIALFIKAVDKNLSLEEIREYNLLVSVFGLRDKYYTKGFLYYEELIKVKKIFADTTRDNFFDSLVFRNGLDFKPWICAEFISDRELIEKYLKIFPQAKAEMRQYSIDTAHFICDFVWSDAKIITFSPEEESEFFKVCEALDENLVSYKEGAKERTIVYVKKTTEELRGDDQIAQKISEYCRPGKIGGIQVTMPTYSSIYAMKHITSLLGKVASHNFVEDFADKLNDRNGGNI